MTGHPDRLRIQIAGGGTGGHVIPALAIAREMRDRHDADVRLVGTVRGIETRLVPEAGFPLDLIHVGQLANVSLATRSRTLFDLPNGVRRCVGLLRSFAPHVVVGVGGYASGPAMMAAVLLRLPTLVYEPNAAPGMVNRYVGRFVSAAAVAYEETQRYFRNPHVTGVPVRAEICAIGPLGVAPPHLLVTAGSNGAKVFNDNLPLIAQRLLTAVPGLTVMHQAGERAFAATEQAYRDLRVEPSRVAVTPFLKNMPEELARATLVLSRSGSTVAELAAAGRPSLLVPFPQAADDHQTRNALSMVRQGAARMLVQADLSPETLLATLVEMLRAPDELLRMSAAARAAARPDALHAIASLILSLARR